MPPRSMQFAAVLFGITSAFILVSGCGQSTSTLQPVAKAAPSTASSTAVGTTGGSANKQMNDEHPHIAGAHGGIIIPIGSDSYHAEAVVEKEGVLRLLTLGADESRIQEVDVQAVKAFVKIAGDTQSTPIELVATPQDGDAEGKTSQFVGKLPETLVGQAIDVTIPNLRIANERFRIAFTTEVEVHSNDEMPAKVSNDEERELYLTSGGKYTDADIKANGNVTASMKFKGAMSAHDMTPKPGDRICPVTLTKANPKFTWQIDGKSYQFCCPPCVDEFVRMAKEEPDKIKAPDDYVQQ